MKHSSPATCGLASDGGLSCHNVGFTWLQSPRIVHSISPSYIHGHHYPPYVTGSLKAEDEAHSQAFAYKNTTFEINSVWLATSYNTSQLWADWIYSRVLISTSNSTHTPALHAFPPQMTYGVLKIHFCGKSSAQSSHSQFCIPILYLYWHRKRILSSTQKNVLLCQHPPHSPERKKRRKRKMKTGITQSWRIGL